MTSVWPQRQLGTTYANSGAPEGKAATRGCTCRTPMAATANWTAQRNDGHGAARRTVLAEAIAMTEAPNHRAASGAKASRVCLLRRGKIGGGVSIGVAAWYRVNDGRRY